MDATTTTGPPCVLLLNGFPGVGKLTTARALLRTLPASARLIDNHRWLDPAFSFHPYRKDAEYLAIGDEFRNFFFSALKTIQDKTMTVIITNLVRMEVQSDIQAFAESVDLARARAVPFVLIDLWCNAEENRKRVGERDVGKFDKQFTFREEILTLIRS